MVNEVKVLVAGKFDVLHPGHLKLFEEARKLGDKLVVVVARDSTIEKRFGNKPIYAEKIRLKFLEGLSVVDEAVLGGAGNEMDIHGKEAFPDVEFSELNILLSVKPDVVCLGYDQPISEERVLEFANEHGLSLKVVRLEAFGEELFKSSKIKDCVIRGREEVLSEFVPVGVKNKDALDSVPVVVGDYDEIADWEMDPKGYFLVRIDSARGVLEAAHCSQLGVIDKIFEGKKPQDIYYEVYKAGLISRSDHASYLGKELHKAFIALKRGLKYVQDSEIEFS